MRASGEYETDTVPMSMKNPAYWIGTDVRKDLGVPYAYMYPGPDHYEPMEVQGGAPAISFTKDAKKTSIEKTNDPGPATYAIYDATGVMPRYQRNEANARVVALPRAPLGARRRRERGAAAAAAAAGAAGAAAPGRPDPPDARLAHRAAPGIQRAHGRRVLEARAHGQVLFGDVRRRDLAAAPAPPRRRRPLRRRGEPRAFGNWLQRGLRGR